MQHNTHLSAVTDPSQFAQSAATLDAGALNPTTERGSVIPFLLEKGSESNRLEQATQGAVQALRANPFNRQEDQLSGSEICLLLSALGTLLSTVAFTIALGG